MDTNRLNRDKYSSAIISFKSEEDRYECLRLLTYDDKHKELCQNTYNEKHLKAMIENSSHFLVYRTKDNGRQIVGFALLKVRDNILDTILICAIPNTDEIGTMVAFGVYNFAISKKCARIAAAPRTSKLRETFLRHGFTTFHGTPGIDEVLEKPIDLAKYTKTNTTRKISRANSHPTIQKSPLTLISNTGHDLSENASIEEIAGGGGYSPIRKNTKTRVNNRNKNAYRYYTLKYRSPA